jgi:RNA polymerase sigma-70 factor (ECF subfamily)
MAIANDEFRRLIETHQRMVFSVALRVTGDYGTAEEVAQDVFLELHRSGENLASEDHVRYWLRRVATHRAIDALRRRSVRPESGADEWIEEQHVDEANESGAGVQARLETLLSTLPESMRVVVVLRYQEEMQPEEIARLLGQSVAAVKSHLHRGLKLLRRKAAVTMKEMSVDQDQELNQHEDWNQPDESFAGLEQELTQALRRVDAPAGFAERTMARAGTAKPAAAKVVTMAPRRVWASGAIAAVLMVGALVGEQTHLRHERDRAEQAQRQFDAAMRITDQTLEHVREQLQQAGVNVGN